MSARRLFLLALIPITALFGGCSAGNSGDTPAGSVSGVPTGIERFLLFPNPVVSGGSFETNTNAYAAAYYAAVDPNNERETLDEFKAANGFGAGGGNATEHLVVFRDVRDLGYGRRMTGRFVGTPGQVPERVAFFVENYFVNVPGGGYNRINVDAAVARDTNWHIGTNAIEWSCHPSEAGDPNCRRYAKYFNFSPSGQRQLAVDLDGRGAKAMPGPCISCHGGRGDPLEADGSFPKVANTLLADEDPTVASFGDVQARLHVFQVDTFEWATTAGFTRADQEARLKDFNTWVLCTYPLAAGAGNAAGPNGCTRRAAGTNEWEGTAAALIEAAYGGAALPNAAFDDSTVPAGWAGEAALYEQVVRPYCRTCHVVRGTNNQDDIDFSTAAKFAGYADRIKAHVFDRGNMPLALIVYQDFWRSSAPNLLAAYIDSVLGAGTATDGSGNALQPGRPIADAGPALRMARAGAGATLSGADSLFASSYTWEVLSSPVGGDAVITSANAQTATFQASVAGDYTVRLTAANGSQSSTDTTTITVSASFPDPSTIRFAHVLDVLRNNPHAASQSCDSSGCHAQTSPSGMATGGPIIYSAIDRNGSGGGEDATDLDWLLQQLRGRVNLTDTTASALLRKPTGSHHNGGTPVNLSAGPGLAAALTSFSKVYYWALNGMPAGGVAANAGANSTNVVTFAPTANIPLNGAASFGAVTYAWSILSQPVDPAATILTPSASTATLRVGNVGVYVVQLQVSNGIDTDTTTRTITVQENPVAASFTPSGNVAVTFTGTPLTGPITLTNTSTGNPTTCLWEVLSGPAGSSLSSTSSCITTTLTVPSTAVGGSYQVRFTGSNVSTNDNATNVINVLSAGSGVNANAGADTANALTFTNPSTVGDHPDSAGIPVATVALNGGGSTGPGVLTYAWSVTSAPVDAIGSYAPTIDNASASSTTLRVRRKGSYTVQLFVSNGLPAEPSNTDTRNITVSVAGGNTFGAVTSTFGTRGCTAGGCHSTGSVSPPSWVNETVSGQTLYQRVTARVTTAAPASSLIVVCPAEGTCGMGQQTGFHAGDTSSYTQFLNWIVDGAPNN
jgi:hypothetical protein